MEVTRKNFFDILPGLKQSISEAEFFAIDLELSGLNNSGRDMEPKPYDTPQQYYEKLFHSALDFLPLQFGLCIFQHDSKGNRYTYQAYNFYLHPFSKLKGFPKCSFQSQCSSIAFLASFGFDFNKAFGEGISFMTQPKEDELKKSIEESHERMDRESSNEPADIPVPEDMKIPLQGRMDKIKQFLDDSGNMKSEFVIIDHCNPLMRRLMFQEAPKIFGEAIHLETADYAMKVWRGGGKEFKKKRDEEKKKEEWKEFKAAVGLSDLIKEISKSGKFIVGHNCLLDVCHMVNRFRCSLPPSYESFKELVHHIFPNIIDTKYISSIPPLKEHITSSALGNMWKTLSVAPFEMPVIQGNVEECSYSNLVDKSHEGGYDAFITGQCLLAMCQFLAKEKGKKFTNIQSVNDILQNVQNRMYLMRVQDVPYLTLDARDTKPPRGHVFHLKFPRDWRQSEIVELFKPFGSVYISFIDDCSAFVALHKREQANIVLKTMTGSDRYKVTSFAAYQKQNARKNHVETLPASPSLELLRKRKLPVQEVTDSLEPSSFFNKKHCIVEQPSYSKRSIDSIPEEIELDNSTSDRASPECGEKSSESAKEFPENELGSI